MCSDLSSEKMKYEGYFLHYTDISKQVLSQNNCSYNVKPMEIIPTLK